MSTRIEKGVNKFSIKKSFAHHFGVVFWIHTVVKKEQGAADGVVTKFTYIRINFFVFAVTFTDVCPYGMLEANAVIFPVLHLKIIIYDTSDTDFSVKK